MDEAKKETASSSRSKILLADDDPGMLRMLRAIFEKNGFSVCGEAVNGLDALVQTARTRPNVILLDIKMPFGNGLTILPVIREIDENARVIMLTSDDSSDSVHTAISLGAQGYFVKNSMDVERLVEAARQLTSPLGIEEVETTRSEKRLSNEDALSTESPGGPQATREEDKRERPYTVVGGDIQGIQVVYMTGGLHLSPIGGVYMYHPLTASSEQGGIGSTMREIKTNPDYFTSLFRRLKGFKEVPSILYDQGADGSIFEIFLKTVPSLGEKEAVAFALRRYTASERAKLPLGLTLDGRPCMLLEKEGDDQHSSVIGEYQLDSQMSPPELADYTCSFGGLSLETCLFLSAFNIQEIVEAIDQSQTTRQAVANHGDKVRAYAEWQGIPKTALYGRLGLLQVPGQKNVNLVVTNAMGMEKMYGEDRANLYYWIDEHSYRAYLQHYQNRWDLPVVPLMQIEGEVAVSLLCGRGKKERFAVKRSKNADDIFNEQGYTSVTVMDLTLEFPTLQLLDLMRPLLVNTLLARFPSLRVEASMESPLDVSNRKRHVTAILKEDGLCRVERDKPFLIREVRRELRNEEINESNPDYIRELVDRITKRCAAASNLPRSKPEIRSLEEEDLVKRVREKDTHLRQERYRQKYET